MKDDVIVVGGGIIGCACALRLAQAGLKVTVIERAGVGLGTTAQAMGHVLVVDGDEAEIALTSHGRAQWQALVQGEPRAVDYSRCGTLWLAQNEGEVAQAQRKLQRLAAHGVRSHWIDRHTLRTLEPALWPGLCGALLVGDDAVLYPPWAAAFLARQARVAGAVFQSGDEVRRVQPQSVVLTTGKSLVAGAVVVAAGHGTTRLLPGGPLLTRKGHLVICARGPELIRHQIVELGHVDLDDRHTSPSIALNLQPRAHGQIVVGSSRVHGDTSDTVDPMVLHAMTERAVSFLPALQHRPVLRAWTGLRSTTPDRRPLIGEVPGRPGLWVAAGHEGLGITTALASADLLRDLLLDQTPVLSDAPYQPARFATSWQERLAC